MHQLGCVHITSELKQLGRVSSPGLIIQLTKHRPEVDRDRSGMTREKNRDRSVTMDTDL